MNTTTIKLPDLENLDPANVSLWFQEIQKSQNRALIRKINEALKENDRALEKDPDNDNALLRKTLCLYLLGRFQDVLSQVSQYSSRNGMLWAKADFEDLKRLAEERMFEASQARSRFQFSGRKPSKQFPMWLGVVVLLVLLFFFAGITGILDLLILPFQTPRYSEPCQPGTEKVITTLDNNVVDVKEYTIGCERPE